MASKQYPSMYDLAFSTNIHARAQTKLAGATVGAVIGQTVAQGKNHGEAMDIARQQIEAVEAGFEEVNANLRVQISNQHAMIQNQEVQSRVLEAIYRRLETIDQRLIENGEKLDAINRGQFAQWRQTGEGRLYLSWERAAQKVLQIRDYRDAVVGELPDSLWADAGLGERPRVLKELKPQAPKQHFVMSPLERGARGVGAVFVALVAFWIGQWSAGVWGDGFLGYVGGFIGWVLTLGVAIFALVIAGHAALGDRGKVRENSEALRAFEAEQAAARAHNAERERAISSYRQWAKRREELATEIGVDLGHEIDWMDKEDRAHLEQIELTVSTSRDRYPAPDMLPVLYLPPVVGDPRTKIGTAILALTGAAQ